MLAALNGHAGIVSLLLGRGADVSVRDNEGKSALDYASTEEVRSVLKAGR
jgi:ankyrin repeat protein